MSDEFDVNTFAAKLVNSNIDRFMEAGKGILNEASSRVRALLRRTYSTYLANASERYSKVKTFLIRDEPTPLYRFYVPLSVSSGDKTLPRTSVKQLEDCARYAIITGTAGSGKTTLMRHLFLDTIRESRRVPVFVELHQLNNSDGTVSDLIRRTLELHGLSLDEKYVTKAIEAGHFAFFLDGFDEVGMDLRKGVSQEIQSLCDKWDKNLFVVSSRPDQQLSAWPRFTVFETSPLSLDEATELVQKLPCDEALRTRFIKDIREDLFEEHRSFLSNPLLLSIMLLTYGQSADIPKKLNVFYSQAYEALYQRHDALKGGVQRPRQCDLDIQDFAEVFSAFCIATYDRRKLEFSQMEALDCLRNASTIAGIEFSEMSYLEDLLQAVCLLLEDGLVLTFAHRSFQEYFVARFICSAKPAHQAALVKKYADRIHTDSVIALLYEMDRELIERLLIVPFLDAVADQIQFKRRVGITHYLRYLKYAYTEFFYDTLNDYEVDIHSAVRGDSLSKLVDLIFSSHEDVFLACGVTFAWSEEKWSEFANKHFSLDREMILTKGLSTTSPFVRDLAQCGNHWSQGYVQALMQIRSEIKDRQTAADKSIDEILSI